MPWMHPDSIDERTLRWHLPLGENPKTRDCFLVPNTDRYAGTHVIGVQGYGKSSLLESLIHHDILIGNAVIVIDAHGDLADHCLAALPDSALERAHVLDLSNEATPFSANLFAQGNLTSSVARSQAVQRIKHVFDVFWPEVMQQQYAPQYLHYATRVFLDNPGTTIYDLKRFLRQASYRTQLLKRVREPQVVAFWREYNALKPDTQESRSRPLLNRWQLLTSSPLLRNIICQPNAIDFRKAIEAKQVLFIKLDTTTMEHEAKMVGTILMGQIMAAIFSFGDLTLEKRPGVSLYVDEVANFAEGPDIERLFSQGRKFGVRLTIAHQRRDQLSPELQKATLSARTTVVFRVTVDDSKKLAQVFPVSASRPKPEDIHLYPCDHLLSHTHLLRDPGVLAFTEDYLLPLQGAKGSHGQVVITDAEFRAEEFFSSGRGLLNGVLYLGAMLNGTDTSRTPVRVPDPTPHLDTLLREVMATNNPRLPIPPEAVRGLANAGGGFFPAVRNLMPESSILQPHWIPPEHLIRIGSDGWEVLRAPEGPTEWLAHCIFMLRQTMAYLAEHPLGNVKETGASEIAQNLVRLPKRFAFVRSGDDFGPIRTFDAPEAYTGDELEMRRYLITRQSRERYCRPREDVEAAFLATDTDGDAAAGVEEEPEPPEMPGPTGAMAELPDEPDVSRWEL